MPELRDKPGLQECVQSVFFIHNFSAITRRQFVNCFR
jgi:hypothetical protein